MTLHSFLWSRVASAAVLLLSVVMSTPASAIKFSAPRTDRIWDNGYCAFPSICEFKGNTYISFREGESHVFNSKGEADGKTRVLISKNGKKWKSIALLSKDGFDLRDPKLSVTPDGRLMILMDGSLYVNKVLKAMVPHVSFSSDGKTFSDPVPAVLNYDVKGGRNWIWRLTWHEGVGYGVVYGSEFALLKTTDGLHYEKVCRLDVDGSPNESTIRFTEDGLMTMMVRRERNDRMGWWGYADAPFTAWQWKPMEIRLGGPDFIIDRDNVIVGSRYHFPHEAKMMILTGQLSKLTGDSADDKTAVFQEQLILPSGRDCSYPGILLKDNEIWVVYYSSHENGKGAIYLSRINTLK